MTVSIPPEFLFTIANKTLEWTRIPGKEERDRERVFFDQLVLVFSDLLAPYRYIDSMPAAEISRMVQTVLGAVSAIVRNYHIMTREDDVRVNTCYMIPVLRKDFTDAHVTNTRFVEEGRDLRKELRAVLQLGQWGEDVPALPRDLCLPIEDSTRPDRYRHLLFGAPRAFESGTPQFVDDTLRPTRRLHPRKFWLRHGPPWPGRFYLPKDLPAPVFTEVKQYFRQHQEHVRSFLSLTLLIPPEDRDDYPAEYRDLPLAVLNIQGNKPRLLGRAGRHARLLLATIVPVLNVLTRYISRARVGIKIPPTKKR